MAQDLDSLRGAAAAFDDQPGAGLPRSGQSARERLVRAVVEPRGARRGGEPGYRGREPAGVFGVEQNRGIEPPVLQVVLGVDAGQERAPDYAAGERVDRLNDVPPLGRQTRQPTGPELASPSRRPTRMLPKHPFGPAGRAWVFGDPFSVRVQRDKRLWRTRRHGRDSG